MKGLLYKDFQIIVTGYRKNALLVLVLYTVMAYAMQLPFLLYALIFLLGLYIVSTLSFDEASHWDAYVRTLPVPAGAVMGAKYLLGLLLMLAGTALTTVLVLLMPAGSGRPAPVEFLSSCATVFCIALLYSALSFPLSLRYGAAKARTSVLAAVLALGCGVYLVYWFASRHGISLPDLSGLGTCAVAAFLIGLLILSLAAYGASWIISTRIYLRKEF